MSTVYPTGIQLVSYASDRGADHYDCTENTTHQHTVDVLLWSTRRSKETGHRTTWVVVHCLRGAQILGRHLRGATGNE
jgi:hypothetical protein